jgi:hypothetical protein
MTVFHPVGSTTAGRHKLEMTTNSGDRFPVRVKTPW